MTIVVKCYICEECLKDGEWAILTLQENHVHKSCNPKAKGFHYRYPNTRILRGLS